MTVKKLLEILNGVEDKDMEVAINGFEEQSCETVQEASIETGELNINEAGNWGHFYFGKGINEETKVLVLFG